MADDDLEIIPPGEEAENDLDAIPNAATTGGMKKQRRTQKLKADASDKFWRDVFASPVGRAEMFDLLRESGALENKFMAGPTGFPDRDASLFVRGAHDFGQRLFLKWLQRDLAGVTTMLNEHDPRFAKKR